MFKIWLHKTLKLWNEKIMTSTFFTMDDYNVSVFFIEFFIRFIKTRNCETLNDVLDFLKNNLLDMFHEYLNIGWLCLITGKRNSISSKSFINISSKASFIYYVTLKEGS